MAQPSPTLAKSYAFSLKIVDFCFEIQRTKKEYVLTKQLLKSGTSIGANVEEATQAQSRNDFIAKLSIAQKEAHETRYWLRLMRDSSLQVDQKVIGSLLDDVQELIRMLNSSLVTAKSKR